MRHQFVELRKQNNINWFTRNIKLLNWLLFAVFALLLVVGIILAGISAKSFIDFTKDQANNAYQTTQQSINDMKTMSDKIWLCFSGLKLFFAGFLGMIASRIIANGCLIYRNYVDYKRIGISKSFFTFRNIMLPILIILIFITLILLSIGAYKNVIAKSFSIIEPPLNVFTDAIDKIQQIGFNPTTGESLNLTLAEQLLTNAQNAMQYASDQLNQIMNPEYLSSNLATIIMGFIFLGIWGIFDIVYGSITLSKSKNALVS